MEGFIKAGTIVVAIEEMSTGCGIRYVKEGSILKVAEDVKEWRSTVFIYRNHREGDNENTHAIDRDKLRLADSDECAMYEKGIYYLQTA